jgi:hypothetical protein
MPEEPDLSPEDIEILDQNIRQRIEAKAQSRRRGAEDFGPANGHQHRSSSRVASPARRNASHGANPQRPWEELYAEAVTFYGRHLVALVVDYIQLDENGKQISDEKLVGFSAFVMSFGGEWFLVTAGHALKEGIDDKVASGRVKLLGASIQDNFGQNAKSHLPTLIDYDSIPKWYIDDARLGLDLGMIHLRDFYRKGLEINGVVPISEANWQQQPDDMLADYCLFGFPEELVGETKTEPGPTGQMLTANIHPVLLHVERTDTSHREITPSVLPWFIGRVNTAHFGLKSIVGMSGGPIFGFKVYPNGEWRYWVVAIQSRWDRATKTVYGCPLSEFGPWITQQFLRVIEEIEAGRGAAD